MTDATQKQCPVLMLARKGLLGEDTKCIGGRCQWWTGVWVKGEEDSGPHHNCSIVLLPGMNAAGTLNA